MLNGCDDNNGYGGSYEGHEDDDFLLLKLMTYKSKGELCDDEMTKCWHPIRGDSNEQSIVHSAGSSKICADKCCCGTFKILLFYPKQDNYPALNIGKINGKYCQKVESDFENETENIYKPRK